MPVSQHPAALAFRLRSVETAEQFAARRREITAAREAAKQLLTDCQQKLTDVAVAAKALDAEAEQINAELRSLRTRQNNIPSRSLELRQRLGQELGLSEAMLPFAGELIQVRPKRPRGRAPPNGCCAVSRCPSWCRTSITRRCRTGSTVTIWAPGSSITGCRSPRGRCPLPRASHQEPFSRPS